MLPGMTRRGFIRATAALAAGGIVGPAAAAEAPKAEPGESFGCEANPTGDPIGGGEGYRRIHTRGDVTVATAAELVAAPGAADRFGALLPEGAVQRLGSQRMRYGGIGDLCYLPDGRAVSASADGTARVWNTVTGECAATFTGATLGAYCVAASPDGARVAAGCKDGIIREFTVADGRLTRELKGHRGWVEAVCFTADGRAALSGSRDGRILKRDVGTGKVLAEMAPGSRVLALARAGNILCAGGDNGKATLWDLATGKQSGTLAGHTGAVNALVSSPDGKRLVTASDDTTLLVWRLPRP